MHILLTEIFLCVIWGISATLQCYLKLCCLGVRDVNCSSLWNLLPKLICDVFLRTLREVRGKVSCQYLQETQMKHLYWCSSVFTRAKLRASVNPAAARSCLNSSVNLLSGNCIHTKKTHKSASPSWWDNKVTHTCTKQQQARPSYLVSYGVGAWCGADYVVETIGNGSILHDITRVDDVRSCRWYLNLDRIANTSSLGAQAHPSEQLGNFLCWLTVRGKWNDETNDPINRCIVQLSLSFQMY